MIWLQQGECNWKTCCPFIVFESFRGTTLYLTAFNSKRELITQVNIMNFAVDLVWHSAIVRKKLWFGEWQSITEAINGNKCDIQTLCAVLIQAETDRCVLVYRWTHGFILFSVYKWEQTGEVRVGQKPDEEINGEENGRENKNKERQGHIGSVQQRETHLGHPIIHHLQQRVTVSI